MGDFLCLEKDWLELTALQRGLGCVDGERKICTERGWFMFGIVLTEGDKRDGLSGQKFPDTAG